MLFNESDVPKKGVNKCSQYILDDCSRERKQEMEGSYLTQAFMSAFFHMNLHRIEILCYKNPPSLRKYYNLSKLYLGNFYENRQMCEPTSNTDRKGEKRGERGKKAKERRTHFFHIYIF